MRHLGRHADAFTERRIGVNGFADIRRLGAQFEGLGHPTDQLACAVVKLTRLVAAAEP